MRAEQKHFIFIVICCSFLFAPGGLFINAGGASTVEITARVSLIAYNVTTSGITASTADITWMTNGLTNSTVEYGLTTAYGLSKNNSEMVENHAITLDALSDGQEYHFRVVSSDSADTTCTSPDFTFTTDSLKSAKSKILGGLPVVELMPGPPIKSVVSGNEIPMTAGNRVRDPVDVVSGDRSALLFVGTGTRLLDRDGWVVKGIGLTRIAPGDVPSVQERSPFIFTGYAYRIEPSGTTFTPPIALEITPAEGVWNLISGKDLSIHYYNPVSGRWEAQSTTTDPTAHTVTCMIVNASDYALFSGSASSISSPSTTVTVETASQVGLVKGSPGGFDHPVTGFQALDLIVIIVAALSTGLCFYKKQDGY